VIPQSVVTQPDALAAFITAHRITCLFLTTSLFNVHARTAPGAFGGLRFLGIGGEAADPSACRQVLESPAPPRALVNAYGPTESSTFASSYVVATVPEDALRLPIGRPIANTTLHVLDRHRRLLPPGLPGELFIGGDGLALGYLDDPVLTAQKFVADPFAGLSQRLYATGDRVVRNVDGDVVFLGRMDDQLKIRGFRVEPLEVERAIRAIDGVETAVVVPRVVDGYPRLVAYAIAGPLVDAPGIRARLRGELPAYLVPSHVVLVDDLPLTRSGKLDRKRLPDPFADAPADTADPGGRTDQLAAGVAELWREVLGLAHVDPNESFFDAGGDSLLAVRLYGAVQRRFDVTLGGGVVTPDLTVVGFTEAVRRAVARVAPPLISELSSTDGPPVLLVAPGGGELGPYRWLVQTLAGRFRIFGIREPGHYGTEPRPRSMGDAAHVCAQALHDAAVPWPVAVVGECAGGMLAHQLACELARADHAPQLVALLDTPVPGRPEPAGSPAGAAAPTQAVSTVRRRGRNAVALTRMQAQWTWHRLRREPAPSTLANSLTLRTNARRLRHARPSHFPGRLLYVQAVDDDGITQTAGAPEYWSTWADDVIVARVPGTHTGTDSFLSSENAGATATALLDALGSAMDADA
jgi:thioesterase domain-containing protein